MNKRAERAQRFFEIPVLFAALLVVPVVLIEIRSTSAQWQQAAWVANWAIWAVFLLEYLVMIGLVDDRWSYTKRAWLDVLIIVLSFPLLPAAFASTRLARLTRLGRVFRILRMVRLAAIVTRGGVAFRKIFAGRGLGYLAAIGGFLSLAFGAILVLVEPEVSSYTKGVWWSIVSLTTFGYADISLTTWLGKAMGIVLTLVGIGFVATLTAAIAAYFVEEEEADLQQGLGRIDGRLDRIESMLAKSASERGQHTSSH